MDLCRESDMGTWIELCASDGHRLSAYEARPGGAPHGGVVVVQEIFGVTAHIRYVADAFAVAGFHAIAPAMFDRLQPDVVLPYTDIAAGRQRVAELTREGIVEDIRAATAHLAGSGRVAVVGYCWGGSVAWIAAATTPLAAAISYYGARIHENLDLTPACPMLFHYGERDASIPPERIEEVRHVLPDAEIHVYPAGHGFNCTDRADYDAPSARLAFERSLKFLGAHLG
jgi:carboxymethylenebutenolidase